MPDKQLHWGVLWCNGVRGKEEEGEEKNGRKKNDECTSSITYYLRSCRYKLQSINSAQIYRDQSRVRVSYVGKERMSKHSPNFTTLCWYIYFIIFVTELLTRQWERASLLVDKDSLVRYFSRS